jgi:hypothetical protein
MGELSPDHAETLDIQDSQEALKESAAGAKKLTGPRLRRPRVIGRKLKKSKDKLAKVEEEKFLLAEKARVEREEQHLAAKAAEAEMTKKK